MGTGRDIVALPGVKVQVIGSPSDNDDFVLSPAFNYAKNLSFLLTSGDQIAAAAKNLVSSDLANTGDASIVIKNLQRLMQLGLRVLSMLCGTLILLSRAQRF